MKGYNTAIKNIPYQLSKDYVRLKKLLDLGYSICCYIDYEWSGSRKHGEQPLRDMCEAKKRGSEPKYYHYELGVRGMCYLDWWYDIKETFSFEELCENQNVEFIDIPPNTLKWIEK